ncbi:CocE/NonD family hydrolase [Streptomyces peucetius]|uniref:CocE/NonD family hydrolase n=1 Tax=Streptomyces peucetius TaxID=1950 RepID=A0ABY6I3S2_STRPE|nr:CocE/NonD family hydrolase [Streptomyces peucetius]UYQ60930.1 CocE/NonD family hydrolase [Streptomyces peucetius]
MTATARGVVDLLLEMRSLNIVLWAEEGRLRFDAPAGVMTDAIRAELVAHKGEIVAFLADADIAERSTVRITMRDGVRLAADVFRPRRRGAVVEEPLPVLWCHERYRRAETVEGGVLTKLDSQPWLKEMLRNEYVVVVVDSRGSGASEGTRRIEFSHEEAEDAFEVTEWIAARPWSSGRVGMYGLSYSGINQLLAAATAPPHLTAILPQMAMFDLYEFLRPGGVFRDDFARNWSDLVRGLDTRAGAAGTGEGPEGPAGYLAGHQENADVFGQAAALEFRDSVEPVTGLAPYRDVSPATALDAVSASGIPVCHLGGWHDIWARDTTLWFRNLDNPQRMVIGPWSHNNWKNEDLAREHLRWYDHWLKGVDNGVMAEPPVRYFTMGAGAATGWKTADTWPPSAARPKELCFGGGPSGTIRSVNDGVLAGTGTPAEDDGDAYTVDYSTTSGRTTRWSDGYAGGFHYDLTPNDRKALTYTSAVQSEDLEVTGHPLVHLWVTSTHSDGAFFVHLSEVDEQGESHYVTEGVLRASYRGSGPAPFDRMGLPYQPGTRDALAPLPPGEPVELVIDLHPTSYAFSAGRRLRVSITCCDRDNARVEEITPAPVVTVHRGARHPSRVVLPVVPRA